jgi:hypothetical protein
MAVLAIPDFWDEGSGGNARASRTRMGRDASFAPRLLARAARLERSATPEEVSFRPAPDSNTESGFCFLAARI